ncbi:FAD/NAD(P)-binding domain-containing protein [Hypomontagnella monticulosa]|nr:FAD/NAD(P)-binding domain-containing protein [Hypomontagnella monticulosa]
MAERVADVKATDKVAIIGAGLSGVGMAIQLKRLLSHDNFELFEKYDDIGGTWSQNTYPNLSCDVPSEFYSYSFFQKPDWSQKFAPQPEILEYMHDCVVHFQLGPHIHLQQECTSISWSEEDSIWNLSFNDLLHHKSYTIQARFVVTATGVLNIPKGLDDLPELRNFGGQCFHTSQWRDIDFDDKRVMVIGNGCSGNQVIPWILSERRPKSLVQIVRSPQWIAPKPNYLVSGFTKWYTTLCSISVIIVDSSKFHRCLRYIPFAMRLRRLWTAYKLDNSFIAMMATDQGTKARRTVMDAVRSYMKSIASPRYHDVLLPHYELGAKRPVMDDGYLNATNRENFTLIQCDGISAIEGDQRKTVVDKVGNKHEVDIVILANGFKTQELLTPMKVQGIGGKDLRETWESKGGSEAYMGVSVNGFPNFFMLIGPNTLPSNNSTLHAIECSIVYVTRLLKGGWARSGGDRRNPLVLMPTPEAEVQFNAMIQRKMKDLVYTSQVSTWYINKDTGKNTLIWPGTQFSFWRSRCVSPIRWSDWTV